MAVVNKRTLVDSGTRHVVMFEINNATNDAVQVVDASALRGHASNPTLDIRSIKWNTTAATSDLAFEFDATTDSHGISVHGSGEYGYHGKQPMITNPEASGVTGDIVITNSSAVTGTFILEVAKTKGYDNSGQTR
tara:strand:- start:451 stop:855 length:405 start_codon:yes stop_codon:yes gene_type:complete